MWLVDGAAAGLLILVSLVRLVRKILGVGVLVEGACCESVINNLGFIFGEALRLNLGLNLWVNLGLNLFGREPAGVLGVVFLGQEPAVCYLECIFLGR